MEAGSSAGDRVARLSAQEAELEERLRRVRQQKQAWQAGQVGEERIAALLSQLPVGWRVIHDRRKSPSSPANIDHIAIGPTGVHVVDAKNWTGSLTVVGEQIRCGSWPRNQEVQSVIELRDLVASELSRAGWPAPVYGVIALANEENVSQPLVHRGVAVMPPNYLLPGMTGVSEVLTPEQVYRIWEFLDDRHPPRSGVLPGGSMSPSRARKRSAPRKSAPTRPTRRAGRSRSAPHVHFGPAFARLVLTMVAIFAALALLPTIAAHIGKSVSASLARALPTTAPAASGQALPARACSLVSERRASQLLHTRVHAVPIAADFCEFRTRGVARPAAVVAMGQAAETARWSGYLHALYGVQSCGAYGPGSNSAGIAACVDTSTGRVTVAEAYAFDRVATRSS